MKSMLIVVTVFIIVMTVWSTFGFFGIFANSGLLESPEESEKVPMTAPAPKQGVHILSVGLDLEIGQQKTVGGKCVIAVKVISTERVMARVTIRGQGRGVSSEGQSMVPVMNGSNWTEVKLNRPCRKFRRFKGQAEGLPP